MGSVESDQSKEYFLQPSHRNGSLRCENELVLGVDGRIVIGAHYQITIIDVRVYFPRFHRSLRC